MVGHMVGLLLIHIIGLVYAELGLYGMILKKQTIAF